MQKSDTIAQLAVIPDLVAECFLTRRFANPSAEALVHTHKAAPAAPIRLDAFDALRVDEHGLLFELEMAVRAVMEDSDTSRDDTQQVTWAGHCAFLVDTCEIWRADQWLAEYVPEQVWDVYSELARVARIPAPPRLQCLVAGCRGTVTAIESDKGWWWPDVCSENHRVDRYELVRRWRDSQPVKLSEAAEKLGCTARALQMWAKDGWISPMARHGNVDFYRFDEIAELYSKVHRKVA